MRRALIAVCLMLVAGPAAAKEDWRTVKSTHFVVYYRNAPRDFCERVSYEAERNYEKITEDLGFLRYDFWLWENRARIYIHDGEAQYQAETGMPAWSAGAAVPRDKVIHAFYGKEGFFDQILPHELGHIIFREFVGFDNPAVPKWLDEGAASYQEHHGVVQAVIAQYVRGSKELMPLRQLSTVDPHRLADRKAVELFYAQAVGVIDFLIREFGKDDFVTFCRMLRDSRDLDKALSYTYSIRGIGELDRCWRDYLK